MLVSGQQASNNNNTATYPDPKIIFPALYLLP